MSRVKRLMIWAVAVSGVLVLSLGVAMALVFTGVIHPRAPVTTTDDPDYVPDALSFCMGLGGIEGSSVPTPMPSMVARGQTAEIRIASFQIAQPVQQTATVLGRQARGVFLVVDVNEWYTGDIPKGLGASPLDYQLVDGNGDVHCTITKPTDLLNQARYPNDVVVGAVWWVQLTPAQPEARFMLVYDIDPALVPGAYLLAFNMPGTEFAALDLGLS